MTEQTKVTELLPAREMMDAPSSLPALVSDTSQVLAIIGRVAMDPNADIDKMERLLAMYQELQKANAEKEFNIAFAKVQTSMPRILKDAKNTQTDSMYARLETINAALIPVYTANGFSLSFDTGKTEIPDTILVTCRLSHVGGHSRPYEYASPITLTGIKGTVMMTRAHGSGSALSYGRRYLTLMIFNATMAAEDDDGNAATPAEPVPKIGPVRKRKIIDGMLDCLKREDGPGLLEITEELETDEKLVIWSELRSWERTEIRALLTKAGQTAGIDPNFIEPGAAKGSLDIAAWSVGALRSAKTIASLETSWKAVKQAFKAALMEVNADTEIVYQDRKAELSSIPGERK